MIVTSRSALARMRLACARALGAELGRLALTLGAHAVEDVLGVLLGQVGALDAHVDDLEAELLAFLVHLLGDALHQLLALVAHEVLEGRRRRARGAAPIRSIGPSRERTLRSSRTV